MIAALLFWAETLVASNITKPKAVIADFNLEIKKGLFSPAKLAQSDAL
jgi:hypothetical protein